MAFETVPTATPDQEVYLAWLKTRNLAATLASNVHPTIVSGMIADANAERKNLRLPYVQKTMDQMVKEIRQHLQAINKYLGELP